MLEVRADFVDDLLFSQAAGWIGINAHMVQPCLCLLAQGVTDSPDPVVSGHRRMWLDTMSRVPVEDIRDLGAGTEGAVGASSQITGR